MIFTYRAATIRFSLDLTDPESPSVPVAIIMVGQSANIRLGATATKPHHPLKNLPDPLIQTMLKDLPRSLRASIDSVCQEEGSLDDIFFALNNRYGQSFYLSDFSEEIRYSLTHIASEHELSTRPAAAVYPILDEFILKAAEQIDAFRALPEIQEISPEQNEDELNLRAWQILPSSGPAAHC